MSVKRSFDTHLIPGLLRSYAASAIRFMFYKVTPCLKIAISWKPASSDFDFFPDAISRTKSRRFSESSSRGVSFTITPQLKSIQFCFFFCKLVICGDFYCRYRTCKWCSASGGKKYNVCTGCSKGSRGDKIIARCTQQV